GAPGPLGFDCLRRIVVAISRRDNRVGGRAVFDPMRQRRDDVMPRVTAWGWKPEDAADRVRPRAAAAVLHPRRQKQPVKRANVVDPIHFRGDRLVVFDRALRRYRRVVPAMILDELAAGGLESAEIGIGRVERFGGLLLRVRESLNDILIVDAPIGLVENHIREKAGPEAVYEASRGALGVASSNPKRPGRRTCLSARRIAGEDRFPIGVLGPGIDFPQRGSFRFGKAALRLTRLADEA